MVSRLRLFGYSTALILVLLVAPALHSVDVPLKNTNDSQDKDNSNPGVGPDDAVTPKIPLVDMDSILPAETPPSIHPDWNETYGGSGDDYGSAIIDCSDGGFAIAGVTYSYGGSDQDGWLIRTDANGKHLWNMTFGGSNSDYFNDIVECDDGGFAITGTTRSYGGSDEDVWLLRTHANGSINWHRAYGGGNHDRGRALVKCNDGGFALAGYTISYSLFGWDGWLIRTNETGDVEWDETFRCCGADDRFEDIVECENGDFALAGWWAQGADSWWMVRTNSNGVHLWNKTYQGGSPERCYSIIECSEGGFALTGWTQSYGAGAEDVLLRRTDSSGNLLWYQLYGGINSDSGREVLEADNGGFVIVGSTSNFGAVNSDLWLIRTNSRGHIYWNKICGGDLADGGSGLVQLSEGNYALVGSTASSGAGNNDAWLVILEKEFWFLESYGGVNADSVTSTIECSSGGYAIAGYTQSYGGSDYDGWLIRTDELGRLLWNKSYGGSADDLFRDIIECDDGGFAIVGTSRSYGGSDQDAWLTRTDANGIHLWNKTYGGGTDDRGQSIISCSDGGFVIAGYETSYASSGWDGWLIRTNETGDLEWHDSYNGGRSGDQRFTEIIECENGDLAIGGWGCMVGGYEYVLMARINATGTQLWFREYNAAEDERATRLVETKDGGFAIAGWTMSYGGSDIDAWLIKTNSSGHHQWNSTIGGGLTDTAGDVVETESGDFYFTGYTMNFGEPNGDLWLVLVNASGHHIQNWTWGGSSGDGGSEIISFDSGDFVLSGGTASYTAGNYDAMLLFWDPLQWNVEPVDQYLLMDVTFEYDLEVSSAFGIEQWWLNDTSFTISDSGTISNTTMLSDGVYGLQVAICDIYSNWLNATFSVVANRYDPTWVVAPTDLYIEFGIGLNFQVIATDPHGIDYYWLNDTSTFDINPSSGTISNVSMFTPVGNYALEIRAFDIYGRYCTGYLSIHVIADPDWFIPPSDQYLEYGGNFSYQVEATDLSGIDAYWINDTTYFTIHPTTGVITNVSIHAPIGIYELLVRAYDPYGHYCSGVFTITVDDTSDPTWLITPTHQNSEYGTNFNYQLQATDPSGIDYYMINDTHFTIDGAGLISNATKLEVGTYWIEIRAYDNHGLYCITSISVSVQDTKPPDWVIQPSDQTLDYGEAFNYQLQATDLSGAVVWFVNDTTRFAVDDGLITNTTILEVGEYGLNITIIDIHGNAKSYTVKISILATTTTETTTTTTTSEDGTMILLLALGGIAAVIVIVIVIIGLRRR